MEKPQSLLKTSFGAESKGIFAWGLSLFMVGDAGWTPLLVKAHFGHLFAWGADSGNFIYLVFCLGWNCLGL